MTNTMRMRRCYTDNLFLIESFPEDIIDYYSRKFSIMGSKGNVYTVTISQSPKCTCPDYKLNHKRCKHIFFVLIRIMNLEVEYAEQTDYSEEELLDMYDNIPEITKALMASDMIMEKYEEEKKNFNADYNNEKIEKKETKNEICPICMDPLDNGKQLVYCQFSCGKSLHKLCFKMWEKKSGPICVFCRANWYNCNSENKHKYMNLFNKENANIIPKDVHQDEFDAEKYMNNKNNVNKKKRRKRSRDKE